MAADGRPRGYRQRRQKPVLLSRPKLSSFVKREKIMTTLRIDTEDKKILKAVRAILETFEVPFEEARSD